MVEVGGQLGRRAGLSCIWGPPLLPSPPEVDLDPGKGGVEKAGITASSKVRALWPSSCPQAQPCTSPIASSSFILSRTCTTSSSFWGFSVSVSFLAFNPPSSLSAVFLVFPFLQGPLPAMLLGSVSEALTPGDSAAAFLVPDPPLPMPAWPSRRPGVAHSGISDGLCDQSRGPPHLLPHWIFGRLRHGSCPPSGLPVSLPASSYLSVGPPQSSASPAPQPPLLFPWPACSSLITLSPGPRPALLLMGPESKAVPEVQTHTPNYL